LWKKLNGDWFIIEIKHRNYIKMINYSSGADYTIIKTRFYIHIGLIEKYEKKFV
jgi:hypothetical protein